MRFSRIDNDHQDQEYEKPTLEAVFEHYGIDVNPQRASGMAHCPLHEDDNPSFSWNTDRQVWKCHSCGEGGDSYTLIMKKEKTDFVGAKRLAASLAFATRDAGGGNRGLSGSSYAGRRKVSARSGDRAGRGNYVPAWRRR
ncbi:CHC2 zinc finger domain-containing protein [Streptomyces sp. NBC_01236]|uniref:CHC2 zinc finger domain-containing protein n=1 Tax=Streptomyces sp. NBC_01236 TaxID=2903789 RepID=UPI002E0E9F16|nr:CHC2 zinc finger domain-containing protein [Streptomyces sp. NBC_01236]